MTDAPGRPLIRVAAVWLSGDSLAMVRRGPTGRWGLPATAVGSGETLAEAVVRAVRADTASDALCGPFRDWSERPDADPHVLTMYFDVVVLDPAPEPPATTELEFRAVPTWEVPELRLEPGLAELLADQGLIDLVV